MYQQYECAVQFADRDVVTALLGDRPDVCKTTRLDLSSQMQRIVKPAQGGAVSHARVWVQDAPAWLLRKYSKSHALRVATRARRQSIATIAAHATAPQLVRMEKTWNGANRTAGLKRERSNTDGNESEYASSTLRAITATQRLIIGDSKLVSAGNYAEIIHSSSWALMDKLQRAPLAATTKVRVLPAPRPGLRPVDSFLTALAWSSKQFQASFTVSRQSFAMDALGAVLFAARRCISCWPIPSHTAMLQHMLTIATGMADCISKNSNDLATDAVQNNDRMSSCCSSASASEAYMGLVLAAEGQSAHQHQHQHQHEWPAQVLAALDRLATAMGRLAGKHLNQGVYCRGCYFPLMALALLHQQAVWKSALGRAAPVLELEAARACDRGVHAGVHTPSCAGRTRASVLALVRRRLRLGALWTGALAAGVLQQVRGGSAAPFQQVPAGLLRLGAGLWNTIRGVAERGSGRGRSTAQQGLPVPLVAAVSVALAAHGVLPEPHRGMGAGYRGASWRSACIALQVWVCSAGAGQGASPDSLGLLVPALVCRGALSARAAVDMLRGGGVGAGGPLEGPGSNAASATALNPGRWARIAVAAHSASPRRNWGALMKLLQDVETSPVRVRGAAASVLGAALRRSLRTGRPGSDGGKGIASLVMSMRHGGQMPRG